MGRHDDSRKRRRSKDESKEEKLLRKAKKIVEKEEGKKRQRHDSDSNAAHKQDIVRRLKKTKRSSRRTHYSDDDDDKRNNKKRSRKSSGKKVDRKSSKTKKSDTKSASSRSSGKKSVKLGVNKSMLVPLGPVRGIPPTRLLHDEDDYFSYHQHLWVYLYRVESTAFSDLTSSQARKAFRRFCERYNAGDLEEAYYETTLPSEAIEQSQTTRHKWAFQTSEMEQKSLQMIEEGVRKQTEYRQGSASGSVVDVSYREKDERNFAEKEIQSMGERARERLEMRRANRRLKQHIRTAEEEMTGGRKDGPERQLELKKQHSAKIHGASRDKEQAMAGAELNDSQLYGGDGSDFQAALAREKRRNAERDQKQKSRISKLQQKEQENQKAMLASLGLTNIPTGRKITIQPRK